jgi:sec-independent protein translocase protein TatB
MFDIGFSELVVIAVVALIVIGPERLPRAARTAGHLFGRLQRYVSDVKADINREMELDELRKLRQEVQSAAQDIESSVASAARDIESSARSVEQELNTAGQSATQSEPAPSLPPLSEPPAERGEAAQPRQDSLPGFEKI